VGRLDGGQVREADQVIYEIHKEVATELKAQGCPLPVVYGPERQGLGAALPASRIVFERDRSRGDVAKPGKARTSNPRMVAARAMGAVCRIYAQSTLTGAAGHDHERLADQAVDLVTVALHKVIGRRQTEWAISSAKLLSREELALRGLEVWPGVVYEMRFAVDRGVFDATWAGEAVEELPVADDLIVSKTEVSLANGPSPVVTETACG